MKRINKLDVKIRKFIEEFSRLHPLTQIIITSPIWIPLIILIVKTIEFDF